MTSFGYRLNPRYVIKECLSCGALYTGDFCCLKGNVEDKILVPKLPKIYARCARCGHSVDGPYFQGCSLLRKKLEEDLVTYFQDFQNTSESSDDSTNIVNAPREPFVVEQDHGVNSSQNPPHIDECCCECCEAIDGIFCQRCTCKSCGKGAHIGYNCPPKVSIISNSEPCNQTMNKELPQTLTSFDPTCYSDKENSVPCVSKPNIVDESSNIFNPPTQPPIYSCEFCGSNAQYGHYCTPQIPDCCDDDADYNSAITPVLSIEEPDNSQSMRDEHLDTISATESDKVIKSSVKDLVPIPSEFEGIPDTMCDVHLINNPILFEAKDHSEIVINSNDDISSSDDDSLYNENIEYVEASPHNSELVSLEVAEIVIPKEEEIEDDNLREKLLNINLLIAKIKELKDNPTPSFVFLTKSSFTYPKYFLEETNTFRNSLHEFESFCFDLEEISSGSTTTHSDTSLPDYEAFYFDDDDIKEISSGSTTTHSDISLSEYDSFIFEEFVDELAHIISPPEYDCFYFRNLPDPGELISILNSGIRKNPSSTTRVNLPVEDDHSPHLAYVLWNFLAYLTYPVILPYLHLFWNEDTIFDPGIAINRFYSFKPEEENGVEEENVVQREEEEVEDISQVQDVVLREKLFSITRLISNIESLNDNFTPDRVFNSFESDNSLLDNYSLEFETFCDHSKETISGNTTHANYSLPEYDSFCFENEPDQERLSNLVENDIPDNSSNDPLLEEVDLFLSANSIPPGIENFADDPEGDIRFLEELLIDNSILSHELSDSNFEDNPSILRPPPEPPDDNFDLEPEVISAVMEDIDEPDEHFNLGGEIFVSTNNEDVDYFPFIRIFLPYLILPEISPLFLSAESEDTIFDH
nr:hypothetical protein [Tanacetum cinerariifolium]